MSAFDLSKVEKLVIQAAKKDKILNTLYSIYKPDYWNSLEDLEDFMQINKDVFIDNNIKEQDAVDMVMNYLRYIAFFSVIMYKFTLKYVQINTATHTFELDDDRSEHFPLDNEWTLCYYDDEYYTFNIAVLSFNAFILAPYAHDFELFTKTDIICRVTYQGITYHKYTKKIEINELGKYILEALEEMP